MLYDSRDPAACAAVLAVYRRNRVAVTADLLVYHYIVNAERIFSDTSRMRLVPEAIRWESLLKSNTTRELQSVLRPIPSLELQNVRLANEAGVVLLAATDVDIPMGVPGLSLHEELVRLVEAGLTPLAALQAATRNPRAPPPNGRLPWAASRPASSPTWSCSTPTRWKDIRNTQRIRAVVANGRLYRRADLDRLLASAAR